MIAQGFERSTELLARAASTVPGGVHSNVRLAGAPMPLFFDRAEGTRLWDVDGNEYRDFVLGQGPMFLGHSNPRIIEAVTAGLRRGQLFAGQHEAEIELAELLCEVIPCAERVRFSSTGSEAVHAALRLARAATGRRRVLKFEGHYHGWFDNIHGSVTPGRVGAGGAAVAESEGQLLDDVTAVPFNDVEAVRQQLAGGDVAALILEPIAANQSVIVPEPGFLEAVRDACTDAGTVLIFDEVIMGFRLGVAGAQGRLGVTPDLAIFGKAMASGFPISCLAGKAELFDGVDSGRVVHAGTFNTNVAAVSASLATVRILLDEPEVYEAARATGEALITGLNELGEPELVVQGIPEVVWMGFGDGSVRTGGDLVRFDQPRLTRLVGELCRRGIYVTTRGTWYMSAAHTTADADSAVTAVADALAAG